MHFSTSILGSLVFFGLVVRGLHMTYQEPDYDKLLYGNVWKHVTLTPHLDSLQMKQVIQFIRDYIEEVSSDILSTEHSFQCINQIDLWFGDSNRSPLLVTTYHNTESGQHYPVSIPVTFGSTFNFRLVSDQNDTTSFHVFTVSQTRDSELYLYAHTHYVAENLKDEKLKGHCHASNKQPPNVYRKEMKVLSNLSSRKDLHFGHGNECPSDTLFKHSSHIDPQMNGNLSQKIGLSKQNKKNSDSRKSNEDDVKELHLRVMCYNIWNFNTVQRGKYAQRMSKLEQVIQAARPDIIGFQEVRFEATQNGKLGPSQTSHLAKILPEYQFVFQPAQLMESSLHDGRSEEGVAIFSKYPIVHHDYLLLFRNRSNSADLNQRVCLHAVVLVPNVGKVHVFTTHLSLSHEAREESVQQILEYMSLYEEELVFFMGDLNATPEEKAIRMLSDSKDLFDAWQFLKPSEKGFTFSTIEDELSKRIDYIFFKRSQKTRPVNIEVLGDSTKSDAASDHRGLLAIFALRKGK